MKLRNTEKTLATAAAKAGMDEKTARKWLRKGKLPSQCLRERNWRTRTDPFEAYWEEIEKILNRAPTVLVTTLFDHLCRHYPGQFQEGQLRTLQRRVKIWRACNGEPQEVFFAQRHRPGEQAQSDFTHMGSLGVTIGGELFDHLVYHFVLTYSNWETTTICFSESFESLSAGLQNALWELGGVPREHRTDSLSSAVHQLKHPEEFTDRYQELLIHYGLKASHSQAGKAHENGDVEQAHFRFKQAVEQELLLRGHCDFVDREAYESFLREVVKRRNAARAKRLGEEIKWMKRLPDRRLEDFTRQRVRVSRESTIRVRHNTYSVDSRLTREWVEVRIFADRLALWYGQRKIDEIPRLRGSGKHRIQYRHVIHSLVKKPGAFERYRYREDLFPSLLFRVAYDELREDCPGTAVRQYLRILLWAAEMSEERVERCLRQLIEQGKRIRADEVWESLKQDSQSPEKWQLTIQPVEVAAYDHLLECAQEVAS
jgi:hypothetical protein